jgi:hypothetical protein
MIGFSAFAHRLMLDVGWGDLIDHPGDDPRTQHCYLWNPSAMQVVPFGRPEVALRKPIIVVKAGRTGLPPRQPRHIQERSPATIAPSRIPKKRVLR